MECSFLDKSGINKNNPSNNSFPPTTPPNTCPSILEKYMVKDEHGGLAMNCGGMQSQLGFTYVPNKDVIYNGPSMGNNGTQDTG